MTPDRAVQINHLLTTCWFVRSGIMTGPAPSLSGIRLDDAQRATRYVNDLNAACAAMGGAYTLISTVALDELPRLFAWAVLERQDTMLRGRAVS